jgi:hypothetical protein
MYSTLSDRPPNPNRPNGAYFITIQKEPPNSVTNSSNTRSVGKENVGLKAVTHLSSLLLLFPKTPPPVFVRGSCLFVRTEVTQSQTGAIGLRQV